MRFKILVSRAEIDGKVYDANDPAKCYIDTESDLVKKYGAEKFMKVEEGMATANAPADPYAEPAKTKEAPKVPENLQAGRKETLEAMTVYQLQTMAAEEEIDLGDAVRKADIIDAILAAQE